MDLEKIRERIPMMDFDELIRTYIMLERKSKRLRRRKQTILFLVRIPHRLWQRFKNVAHLGAGE